MSDSILGAGESSEQKQTQAPFPELPFQGREMDATQVHREIISTHDMWQERLGEHENRVMG